MSDSEQIWRVAIVFSSVVLLYCAVWLHSREVGRGRMSIEAKYMGAGLMAFVGVVTFATVVNLLVEPSVTHGAKVAAIPVGFIAAGALYIRLGGKVPGHGRNG